MEMRKRDTTAIDEYQATLRWIATALPVLETMCRVAGLTAGQEKAREMSNYLRRRHNIRRPARPRRLSR